MTERERKKGELIQLFKTNSNAGENTATIKVNGSGNIIGSNNNVAGGDINIHIIEKPVRPTYKFTPDPAFHIQPPITGKIQRLVYKLADIESTAGNGDVGKLRTAWWAKLNKHFGVGTYKEIPASKGEQAVSWLQQHVAMNRPKLRKTDKQSWRGEHYTAIWARTREFGLIKADVYALVKEKLGVQVVSLKQLSDRNLKKFYSTIMSMKR